MVRKFSRVGAGLAMAASLSMVATPALADGWGGWGGGGYHRHHHDGGGDAAAIIAGLLVIGGIAAIASSSNHRDRDRYRDEDYRYRDGESRDDSSHYGDSRDDGSAPWGSSVSEDTAVNNCVAEIQRDSTQVDSVDSVNPNGNGWRVEGRTSGGRDFTCSVSGRGEVFETRVD